MGGKRPDQHNIAPEEAGATDYKTRPLVPQDAEGDDQRFSRVMENREGAWQAGERPAKGRKSSARKSRKPK